MSDSSPPAGGTRLWRHLAIAIAVVVIGCIAWYAWGYFAAQGTIRAVRDSSHEPINTTSVGAADQSGDNIDIANYPNSAFTQLPYGVQIDKTSRYFEQKFSEGAVENYIKDNAAANGYDFKGGVGSGSIDDTPQEIINRITVKIDTARHEQNLNLARNAVSGIFMPDSASYTTEIKKIGDGSQMTPTTFQAFESTPVFTQGSFGSVKADGAPTRVFAAVELVSGRVFDAVVQEKQSSVDPNRKEVVVVAEIDATAPGSVFTSKLNGWKPLG